MVGGALLLRPTQSLSLCLQQIGRALRPYPGKKRAVIIDAVGNTLRHGHPLEERDWSLDSKPRRQRQEEEAQPRIKVCPECECVHPPAPACPNCGFEYPSQARQIAVRENATLAEVKVDEAKLAIKREQAKCRTLDELRQLGEARGYRSGWADYVWSSRQNRPVRWQTQPGR